MELTRRTLLKSGGWATVGLLTVGAGPCNSKNISPYVSTIIGALDELKPLLPNQSELLSRAVSIAKNFDDAYRAGKFDNATALFENLAGVVGDIADSAGIASPSIKVAIAVAGIAMRAIAVAMKQQADDNPTVAAVVAARTGASKASASRKSLIERMADEKAVNQLFEASKP